MNNSQIAEIFENIAGLLEMKGEQVFTIRAYQRVARTISHLPTELDQMVREERDLKEVPGVGQAISEKIKEMIDTGKLGFFERLKADFPEGVLDVMRVPGVGPKTTKRVWKELGVSTVAQLEDAIRDGRLASLPRMGGKTADNILRAIRSARPKDSRMPIARALPVAERLVSALRQECPSIGKLHAAGSLRRFEETIGDIDLVCTTSDPEQVLAALAGQPNVTHVLGHGSAKTSVVLNEGVQVDLRVVEDSRYGSLLQYFTGSQQHNIRLREYAGRMGLSLNEYGIKTVETGQVEEFDDEESFYARLSLQYITPELRQGIHEVQRAREGRIPGLVELGDLRGDLHVHTDWSDGRDPMEIMIAGAREQGHEYVAITDHSAGRGIANGLSPDRLRRHGAQLRRIEERMGGIKVLLGSEVDIRADGSLDYPNELLESLDWVVASVHSAMSQEPTVMTRRIIQAMRNPHVTAIGHLTTRLIGERKPIDADFEALFRAAADTGTALEINGSPERLDLRDAHVMRAREIGVALVIDSDAHTVEKLENQRYGVAVARRGWCEARHIVNTMPLDSLMSYLDHPKAERPRLLGGNG